MSSVTSSTHWGAVRARVDADGILTVVPHEVDPSPSVLVANLVDGLASDRVLRPAVRRGWWEQGPGPRDRRMDEEFVEVEWDEILDRVAVELDRVIESEGNSAVFGGSYGWGSAGRFHHAQSQVHRFLNALGGYTRSLHTYSHGAASVVLPHVLGRELDAAQGLTSWSVLAEHGTLILAFGGLPAKNLAVAPGGAVSHGAAVALEALLGDSGPRIVSISPVREDAPRGKRSEWLPIRPGTDVALMMAMIWTLLELGLADERFLTSRCVGWPELDDYLRGRTDGLPKHPAWAAGVTGIPEQTIRDLAIAAATNRTFVSVAWSLQRADHGEQPPWAGIALAAALGQIGLPGGGFGLGYGSMGDVGNLRRPGPLPTLSQGRNLVDSAIPVARIADALLQPGASYDYDGGVSTYPEIRLVYWCGGNPFHHHQDLSRLSRAFSRPDTVIVHEPYWTATARHADIVLPVATPLERDDIGASRRDPYVVAMQRAVAPIGEARTDHEVFRELASRLGAEEAFTEGRDVSAWLRHLYDEWRAAVGGEAPGFDEFWASGIVERPGAPVEEVMLADFVRDPAAHPLSTPSGRIELYSRVVADFGYADCPGHPAWLEPANPPGPDFPLVLVTTQPATRLHSQLDAGAVSRASKIRGREPVIVHPDDAAARGIRTGDLVEVRGARGACLAGARVTDGIVAGCVQMATGAWYQPELLPDGRTRCARGNVNAVTADVPTSRLAQACAGTLTSVQIHRVADPTPLVDHSAPHRGETAA